MLAGAFVTFTRKIPSRRAEGRRRRVYLIEGRGRALAGEKESREKGTLLEMTLLINAGRNGAGRGIPPRYALQGTRNTREVRERHTLWTFVTREAGRYTRALAEIRLFLALVTFSLRALIFTAAEALSLSLSLPLSLGAPNAYP